MTPKRVFDGFVLVITASVMSYLASIEFFGISKDVEEYRTFFHSVENYSGRFEILFVIITQELKTLSEHFSFFLFFITFSSLLAKFGILANFKLYLLNFVLYLLILYPIHELTQYRASIALALLYSAFLCRYHNRHIWLAWLLFSASVLFHYSTIAFIPILIGWNYLKENFSIKIPLVMLLLGLFWFLKPLIQYYVGILNPTLAEAVFGQAGNPFSSRNLVLMSVMILGLLNWSQLRPTVRPFYFISVYGMILWFVFIDMPTFSHRLFEMTFFAYFIWVSELKGFYRLCAYALLLILAVYLGYRTLYIESFFLDKELLLLDEYCDRELECRAPAQTLP